MFSSSKSSSRKSSVDSKGRSFANIIMIILFVLILGILAMCIYKAYIMSNRDTTKAFYITENREKRDITSFPFTIVENTKYLYIPYKFMIDLNTKNEKNLFINIVQDNDVKITYQIDLASVAGKDKGFNLYKKCKSIEIKYERNIIV